MCTLLMWPNKFETGVQCFRMSCASIHGNSIYNIIPLLKKENIKKTYILDIWYLDIFTGWNDKIVTLEKTTWFHFRLMKTGFRFLLQTIYSSASCVQIARAKGAFYHVWKLHNVQWARSEMRRCTIHALYRSKLWQPELSLDCHE